MRNNKGAPKKRSRVLSPIRKQPRSSLSRGRRAHIPPIYLRLLDFRRVTSGFFSLIAFFVASFLTSFLVSQFPFFLCSYDYFLLLFLFLRGAARCPFSPPKPHS
mmetsp:Transcript_30196/g.92364  ORF Transcript_30196/g.92364 Transcript_30196/m.92364 type:complete len:104 (+) Transcript_30196:1588-1899(+)